MTLSPDQRNTVVNLEYEKALQILSQIDALKELKFWDTIANRLYYAVFHAVSALLIHDGHQVKSHKGVVQVFGLNYIVTRVFSLEEGKLYSRLQTLREEGDYNCYIQADADIELMIEPARRFVDHIGKYIGII